MIANPNDRGGQLMQNEDWRDPGLYWDVARLHRQLCALGYVMGPLASQSTEYVMRLRRAVERAG